MSQFDNFMNSVDKIGTTQPMADEFGNLTMPPVRQSEPTRKSTFENVQKPSEQYSNFFENIDSIVGGESTEDPAKLKARTVLSDAIDIMDDKNLPYWTNDKTIMEACSKLRQVLSKVITKI